MDGLPFQDLPYDGASVHSRFVNTCNSCSFDLDRRQVEKVLEAMQCRPPYRGVSETPPPPLKYPARNGNSASKGRRSVVGGGTVTFVEGKASSWGKCCRWSVRDLNRAPKNQFCSLKFDWSNWPTARCIYRRSRLTATCRGFPKRKCLDLFVSDFWCRPPL